MSDLTFLVGGARSGKSTHALRMAERADARGTPVTFLVTAVPFDADLADRVQRHRDERPPHWTTVECPVELAAAIDAVPADHHLVVDCLTVWLGNLFVHVDDPDSRSTQCSTVIASLSARRQRGGHTTVVSNEVGMGIHPELAIARVYRDELGRLNQGIAAIADRSLLLVAGRALPLHDPTEYL